MANAERFILLFDNEFSKLAAGIEGKLTGEKFVLLWPGTAVILSCQPFEVPVVENNTMAVPNSIDFLDPFHPVVDTATKQVIGIFFHQERFWYIYRNQTIRQGIKVAFGRYLVFLPAWRMLHYCFLEKYQLPSVSLLMPN